MFICFQTNLSEGSHIQMKLALHEVLDLVLESYEIHLIN